MEELKEIEKIFEKFINDAESFIEKEKEKKYE